MDLDAIIESLNKKLKTFNAPPTKLEELDLSEAEQSFDQQYKPDNVLIVYGTLAPGRTNYKVIEHIKGQWQQGITRGKLVQEGWGAELGYYAFKHVGTEEQEEIKAFVLTSDELIANWKFLDEFEGSGYRRILAKYELDNGEIGAGFIYAVNEEQVRSATELAQIETDLSINIKMKVQNKVIVVTGGGSDMGDELGSIIYNGRKQHKT